MSPKITHRQFLAMLFCALLAPLVRIIPGNPAGSAGTAGVLTPLAALPLALLAAWWIGSGLRRTEGGLAALYRTAFGEVGGRAACGVSALVIWLLLCCGLRLCGERFVSSMYPDTGLGLFFLCLLAAALWVGRKNLAVCARAGQIFLYVVLAALLLVLALSVGEILPYHIWPLNGSDLLPAAMASGPLLGALSCAAAVCFLRDEVQTGRTARTLRWCVGLALVLTAISFAVVGVFGAGTVAELQVPLFSLAKEANVEGAVERLESVVSCVWVFTDVLFLTLLAKSAAKAVAEAARCGGEKQLLSPLLAAAFPMGWLIAPDEYRLETLCRAVLVPAELLLLLALPAAACLAERVRYWRAIR